ncbi:threonyl and Alanyl tRNA synthetase second additional domain protein [Mycobacterium xenopi 4042]|uniref:Threonyl and Alanyl tRNA synthetase second additional domain protein n=1 Tax=Mycobacterium xenopi 4042 TaxID=1299334 RepID=X8CEP2_MYCXE|nr:threonyl and Alanyl tRNA synthetase second additional domain protein [Mycobacterium xenopi 4042]
MAATRCARLRRTRDRRNPDPGAGRDDRGRRRSGRGLPSRGAPDAVVVVRDADGKLRDLSWAPEQDVDVVPVAANTEDGRSVIRHSCAHVLAQAVQDLFPQAKLGIGPPISDGFYYDFDVPEPFTPEDLEALEKRMRQIVKDGQLFSRRVYQSEEQARAELADEPYKLELVEDKSGDPAVMEVGGDELTAYDNLNPRTRQRVWSDLCRGPHIPTTRHIPAFKLTRTSAAYWRGDQNNPACNAFTARPGNRRRRSSAICSLSRKPRDATTASSAPSSTCSAFPTKSVPA